MHVDTHKHYSQHTLYWAGATACMPAYTKSKSNTFANSSYAAIH